MKTLTREEFKSLAQEQRDLCFSFYVNTAKAGVETLRNPVRFQRLIGEAHERLVGNGIKSAHAKRLLEPAIALLDDYYFWQEQDRGLAVFLNDGTIRAYKLPYEVTPLMVGGESFHLKPLLPLLAYDGNYFILALSKNAVELYRATRFTIEKIPLRDVPQTEAEALRFDDPEKSVQVHGGEPVGRGEQSGIFHGQGAHKEDTKERTLRFFHKVANALHPYLNEEHSPLLLAGVEYYLPIYRNANTYPHLIEDVIAGNPEGKTPDELRKAAWAKLEPLFKRERAQTEAAIEAGLNKDKATDDVREAVAAARHGRVDKCLVELEKHCWGSFDESNARVSKLPAEDRHAVDLLDYAAVQTVLHGGDVFPVSRGDRMPGKSPLAVLYRF